MTYACMTADELALWQEAAANVRNGGTRPCLDCPLAFHSEMKARGCCDRVPFSPVRRLDDEDRRLSHNAANRRYRMARARSKWDNQAAGSGRESNRMSPDLRRAATTRGPEVVASLGVVAQ